MIQSTMQTKFLNREKLIRKCQKLSEKMSQRKIAIKLGLHYNTVYKYIHTEL